MTYLNVGNLHRAAMAAALLPAAAAAQDVVIADRSQASIIVTATGAEQYEEQTGQAISRIEAADLERLQLNSVSDILSTTAGVTVSRNGGIGGVSTVRIRGAEGDQTLVLLDGVRLNDPSSPGGGFDFGNLLVGNIARIEVLRGPNSVPWGSQALGGVVNIVTASADRHPSAAVRAEVGSKDRISVVGNAGGRFGIVSASFGGGYFRDDGISAFSGGTEADGYRQYAGNGRIGIDLGENLDLDLRGYFADSRVRIDGFPPPFFGFADTSEFSTTRQLAGYAGVNLRLLEGNLKSRIAFTLSDIDRDNFDAPGQAVPSFLARGRTERFEYQGDARISRSIRAVFGAEHERSRFSDGFARERTEVTSGYLQLVADVSSALTVTGGARLDDHRDYGSQSAIGANMAWRPAAGTVIRAAYGEGFKAPTLFQLFSAFGNATLQPEEARSYELGVEQWLIGDRMRIGATLFRRNTRNQIDFVSCFGQTTGICTNRPFGTFDNVDRSRAEGLEATLLLKPSTRLTLDASYSLIDASDRGTGLRLLRRPAHSVNVAIDWAARDWLKLGAWIQTVSDSADNDFQTFSRTSLDGYTLVGLRASVPINDRLHLYGRIENLFDTRYQQVSGYGTYDRTVHLGVRAGF